MERTLKNLQQQVKNYDDLTFCLVNVRQQHHAIQKRDRLEEKLGKLYKLIKTIVNTK